MRSDKDFEQNFGDTSSSPMATAVSAGVETVTNQLEDGFPWSRVRRLPKKG